MTLIELIMALGITLVAVAIASSLVMQGAYVTRQGEQSANTNDASRYAGDVIASSLMSGGLGAAGGLYIALSGGVSSHLVSPIMAVNNPLCTAPTGGVTCPDELWVVLPHRNALRNSCTDTGGGVMVQNVVSGTLQLRCSGGLPAATFKTLMATNMVKGALLTNPTFDNTGTFPKINGYTELGNNYSDTPERGGFQVGDLVYPVTIMHYYVASLASGTPGDMTAPTALWSRQAKVATTFTNGTVPFADMTTSGTLHLVQTDIEDMQLAFGFDTKGNGDPGDVQFSTWNTAWTDNFRPNLRSVRVSVVSKSARYNLDSGGKKSISTMHAPITVEDHAPSATPDGYSRNWYKRRVELPNLSPGNI
jgi:hypothetical protein